MLRVQALGLVFFLASCFLCLEWLHQFPVLSGTAFVTDHLTRADDWKSGFDLGRRLRSGDFEVNGLFTARDVRSRGLQIPKILHQVRHQQTAKYAKLRAMTLQRLDGKIT